MSKESENMQKFNLRESLDSNVLKRLSNQWNETLREIFKEVAESTNQSVEVVEDKDIPRRLEEMTEPKLKEKAKQSNFLVVSSIAGGGKSTIGKKLESIGFNRMPRVTTRAPRPGEVNGYDYEFIDSDTFEVAKESGDFLYHKDTYGDGRAIRKSALDNALQSGKRFYAEGDALAYDTIRKDNPDYADLSYTSVFLMPDSFDTALSRLEGRVQDNIEKGADVAMVLSDVEERINKSIYYLRESGRHIVAGVYDGFIVNDDLNRVEGKLREIFEK